MVEEDLPRVYDIEVESFPDPWSQESFLTEINNTTYSYPFVIELENDIIGYTVCWYYCYELHIGNVAVKKGFQGKGYGDYLMKKIFETFPEFQKAFLEVGNKNEKAVNLYLKYGFVPTHTRKKYYPNGEDAIVMIKRQG